MNILPWADHSIDKQN